VLATDLRAQLSTVFGKNPQFANNLKVSVLDGSSNEELLVWLGNCAAESKNSSSLKRSSRVRTA
jgi:hypothetical protein